jgi:tyrosinase
MTKRVGISRRSVFQGAASAIVVLSFDDWLLKYAHAQPRTTMVRFEVNTPEGQKMLALYAQGVETIKKLPLHDPMNWFFQANIHDYPANEQIDRIFDPSQGSTPQERAAIQNHRELALGPQGQDSKRIWRTCSHFHPTPNHFLSWHRMEVYFLERMIEKVVGQRFALPYWGYLPDRDGKRRLPAAFLPERTAGKANPLYFSERNSDFKLSGRNNGLDARDVEASGAFGQRELIRSRSRDGFSVALEGAPHGLVHTAVGTELGMGDTPMAARDPIFWLHHANIDRLWESWRRPAADGSSQRDPGGSTNWPGQKFAFVGPERERIEMTAGDVLRLSSKLLYRYDSLEPVPMVMAVADEPDDTKNPTTLLKSEAPNASQVFREGVPVSVGISPAVPPPVALGFGEKPATRYHLVVELEANGAPGGVYDVILRVPGRPGSSEQDERVVGTYSFFGAGHGADHGSPNKKTAAWRAEISGLVREKLVDPAKPGQVIFKARYASSKVPITIKSVRIEAK